MAVIFVPSSTFKRIMGAQSVTEVAQLSAGYHWI
jgi:hypothetical protein